MRGTRTARAVILAAAAATLMLLPVASSASGAPVATKSGTLINYVGSSKLKVAKKITYPFVCSANCTVTASDVLKGPGGRISGGITVSLAAGVVGGVELTPNGPLLKALKADTGKFKLSTTLQATNQVTGATETISRTFKFKR